MSSSRRREEDGTRRGLKRRAELQGLEMSLKRSCDEEEEGGKQMAIRRGFEEGGQGRQPSGLHRSSG